MQYVGGIWLVYEHILCSMFLCRSVVFICVCVMFVCDMFGVYIFLVCIICMVCMCLCLAVAR